MQLRLRDFLGRKFNDMKKTSSDVFENPRAMAKLFKEAGRLKNILSANADHYAQVREVLYKGVSKSSWTESVMK
jgi:hypoxia up-regulated 1